MTRRDHRRIGGIDYLLMGIGASLAAYSAGQSIGQPDIAWFFVQWIVSGTFISFLIRTVARNSPIIQLDAVLYPLVVGGAIFFGRTLNGLLPSEGFPLQLLAACWLSWMLVVGSFVTWRDSTLLFQAVPAIALFGLVGCYDTFRDVTYAFFSFLVCLATFFARAHGREMLKQAVDSGFFGRPETGGTTDETEQAERISAGPWKWVAGPEWALASALVIVLLSLLGAPVIQQSVSGVAGIVRVTAPPVKASTSAPLSNAVDNSNTVFIGRGPNTGLTSAQLYAVRGETGQYWRTAIFDTYGGRGWRRTITDLPPTAKRYASKEILYPLQKDFSIQLIRLSQTLPVPGTVSYWELPNMVVQRLTGVWETRGDPLTEEYKGRVIVSRPDFVPTAAKRDLPEGLEVMMERTGISVDVQRLAQEVSASGRTDYEKAKLIQAEIARRVKYNLNAAAVPPEEDPVRYCLFDQHEGYCDLFASSMTLMARSVGIPARYVQGYLPDAENRDNLGRELILDKDYHAWSELFFKDVGWVIFDATEGAEQVPGGERGSSIDSTPWLQRPLAQTILNVLIGVVVLGGGLWGWLSYRATRASRTTRSESEAAYRRFADALANHAKVRRTMGQTPKELFALAEPSLGPLATEGDALNRRFVTSLYGPDALSETDLRALQTDLGDYLRRLKRLRT
jgi:transglutaminase-like putative cysteine protease